MRENIYDIGLVCVANLNIGNNLTNYALYQYLCDLGAKVLLICNPREIPYDVEEGFRLFQEIPYPKSDVLMSNKDDEALYDTNFTCAQYILGSDQLWREFFVKGTDYFTCLDWAGSRKHKTAYATSFGTDRFEGNIEMQEKMGFFLRRFQEISVREQDGVNILKELYGIKAEHVLDPVFLCEKRHYESKAVQGKKRIPQGKYVGAYLLDITEEKKEAVKQIAAYASDGCYRVITQPGEQADGDIGRRLLDNPTVEEWLAMIKYCDFFVTDSFHGMCFALIFQKQFCVIFNHENWRGLSRIQSLLEVLGLSSRLVEGCDDEKITALYQKKTDYSKVDPLLSEMYEKSKNWLLKAIEKGRNYRGEHDIYDFVRELDCRFRQAISMQKETFLLMNYKARNEIFLSRHPYISEEKNIRRMKGAGRMQIVGWGAGDCFRRNVSRIKKFYKLKYVCDSNPEKWGKEIEEQIVCISPKMLSEMRNIMVIIMVDNTGMALQIVQELLEMGISNFDHVENWLAFVEGD